MSHPYRSLPNRAFWSRSVGSIPGADVDPVGAFGLKIQPEDLVATAGSCFAQHIARHLDQSGFRYYVTEPGHAVLNPKVAQERQYGLYSARYGNIYTTRQLLQLVLRAYGEFTPQEDCWEAPDGRSVDPFRPSVEPGGFASEAEMRADRVQHLAAVRRMLETLDVFVFTLGLTECWRSKADGAVFPICPGVSGGEFDPDLHEFHNLTLPEVVADLQEVIRRLRAVNPGARVLLTVSPVPLAATAREEAHVLAATAYSKAVLRVAAETLTATPDVFYFPSYEIVTGAHARGAYFAEDLRNVTEAGVSHVMRLVLKHATAQGAAAPVAETAARPETPRLDRQRAVEKWVELLCDEEALDPV